MFSQSFFYCDIRKLISSDMPKNFRTCFCWIILIHPINDDDEKRKSILSIFAPSSEHTDNENCTKVWSLVMRWMGSGFMVIFYFFLTVFCGFSFLPLIVIVSHLMIATTWLLPYGLFVFIIKTSYFLMNFRFMLVLTTICNRLSFIKSFFAFVLTHGLCASKLVGNVFGELCETPNVNCW